MEGDQAPAGERAPAVAEGSGEPQKPMTALKMLSIVLKTSVGSSLEWFDFALIGYFSELIGRRFFPSDNSSIEIMFSFGVFGAAFLTRPLGGLLFGYLGDRKGRMFSLRVSILCMALPTCIIAILPSYAEIGMLAPVLLVLVRFVQGLSVGGEWVGSMIYVFERAPKPRVGTFMAMNSAVEFGNLAAVGIASALRRWLTTEQLESWGWRLPFASGLFAAMYGLWMRRGMEESEVFVQHRQIAAESKNAFASKKLLLLLLGLVSLDFVVNYLVAVWLPTFLTTLRANPIPEGYDVVFVLQLIGKFLIIFWAYIGDRTNRVFLLQLTTVIFALSGPMLFQLFAEGDVVTVVAALFFVTMVFNMYEGCVSTMMCESLPDVGTRFKSFGLTFNFAGTIFGSTTPLFATFLAVEASPVWVGVLLSIVSLVTLSSITMLRMHKDHLTLTQALRPALCSQPDSSEIMPLRNSF